MENSFEPRITLGWKADINGQEFGQYVSLEYTELGQNKLGQYGIIAHNLNMLTKSYFESYQAITKTNPALPPKLIIKDYPEKPEVFDPLEQF